VPYTNHSTAQLIDNQNNCQAGLPDENFNKKPNNAKRGQKRLNRLFKGQKKAKL